MGGHDVGRFDGWQFQRESTDPEPAGLNGGGLFSEGCPAHIWSLTVYALKRT